MKISKCTHSTWLKSQFLNCSEIAPVKQSINCEKDSFVFSQRKVCDEEKKVKRRTEKQTYLFWSWIRGWNKLPCLHTLWIRRYGREWAIAAISWALRLPRDSSCAADPTTSCSSISSAIIVVDYLWMGDGSSLQLRWRTEHRASFWPKKTMQRVRWRPHWRRSKAKCLL